VEIVSSYSHKCRNSASLRIWDHRHDWRYVQRLSGNFHKIMTPRVMLFERGVEDTFHSSPTLLSWSSREHVLRTWLCGQGSDIRANARIVFTIKCYFNDFYWVLIPFNVVKMNFGNMRERLLEK
jgi:hypothetical protein